MFDPDLLIWLDLVILLIGVRGFVVFADGSFTYDLSDSKFYLNVAGRYDDRLFGGFYSHWEFVRPGVYWVILRAIWTYKFFRDFEYWENFVFLLKFLYNRLSWPWNWRWDVYISYVLSKSMIVIGWIFSNIKFLYFNLRIPSPDEIRDVVDFVFEPVSLRVIYGGDSQYNVLFIVYFLYWVFFLLGSIIMCVGISRLLQIFIECLD